MRIFICLCLGYSFLQSSIALSHTSQRIGFNAGEDMAARLWVSKYHRDCWNSDRFFGELDQMQRGLSSSPYHQGYRKGIESAQDKIAGHCHNTAQNHQGSPKGECPETGFQHGSNLGMQVCNGTRSSTRSANTCSQQAMATCYDGLQRYVRENCSDRFRTVSYKQAERECQQTFSMR